MKKTIIAAGILLVVQLILIVVLNSNKNSYETSTPDTPFIETDVAKLNSFKITDGQGVQLVVEKVGGKWVLPDSFSAVADQTLVSGLLQKFTDLKQGFVIATSSSAATRFKVANDDFERHLELYEGEKIVSDFYLGTSPGFRQIHARKNGRDDIIAIYLSSFEVETSVDKWLDKSILLLKRDELSQIRFNDFTLQRDDDKWILEGFAGDQKTDPEEITQAVEKVTGLTIKSVLDPQEVSDAFSASPAELAFTVKKSDEKDISFSFVKLGDDRYGVKTSDDEHYYLVHSLLVENLKKITRQTLLAGPESEGTDNSKSNDNSKSAD